MFNGQEIIRWWWLVRILFKLLYVATWCCVMFMVWLGSGIILGHLVDKNTSRNVPTSRPEILILSWRLVKNIRFCCHEHLGKCLNLSSRIPQLNTAVKCHNVSSGTSCFDTCSNLKKEVEAKTDKNNNNVNLMRRLLRVMYRKNDRETVMRRESCAEMERIEAEKATEWYLCVTFQTEGVAHRWVPPDWEEEVKKRED